jgi:hypothetical protein
MVSPVDPAAAAARLAALMRSAFEARGMRPPRRSLGPAASPRAAPDDVRSVLATRIRALSAGQPAPRGAVVRLLVESLLARELGHALLNDPRFQSVVDDVVAALEESPVLRADLDRIVEHLAHGD